jgi:hypothetical protein
MGREPQAAGSPRGGGGGQLEQGKLGADGLQAGRLSRAGGAGEAAVVGIVKSMCTESEPQRPRLEASAAGLLIVRCAVPIRKVVRSGCLNCAPLSSLHQFVP